RLPGPVAAAGLAPAGGRDQGGGVAVPSTSAAGGGLGRGSRRSSCFVDTPSPTLPRPADGGGSYARALVLAAFFAAAFRTPGPFVRDAFFAAAGRSLAVRRFAAPLACFDSASLDTVLVGSPFSAFKDARERFGLGFALRLPAARSRSAALRVDALPCPFFGAG